MFIMCIKFGDLKCVPALWALSDDARLTSVAYIEPKSTTDRPRLTKMGTEVAHVTRDSDTTFNIKSTCSRQGHIVAASRTACSTYRVIRHTM